MRQARCLAVTGKSGKGMGGMIWVIPNQISMTIRMEEERLAEHIWEKHIRNPFRLQSKQWTPEA